MKTFFKFFTCMLFAGAIVSLQSYTFENRTPYKIRVGTSEAYPNNKIPRIPIKKVVISWIAQCDQEIPPAQDLWFVTLESGQKAEIILEDDQAHCEVYVNYDLPDYDRGSIQWSSDITYYVAAHDELILEINKPKLINKSIDVTHY